MDIQYMFTLWTVLSTSIESIVNKRLVLDIWCKQHHNGKCGLNPGLSLQPGVSPRPTGSIYMFMYFIILVSK